jgi:ferredoxin-NADP reductase
MSSSTVQASAEANFVSLQVREVVRETADANSFVFDVPGELAGEFSYQAGQFVTVRPVIDGRPVQRCYSMSSAPAVDSSLRVTVKRVAGGPVSNWLADNLAAGDRLEVSRPGGRFVLRPGLADVVAFAGGSGITPVLSILKTVLATTDRNAALYYANRDAGGVIFAGELAELARRYGQRLTVVHHYDAEQGFLDRDRVRGFAAGRAGAEFYVCGPAQFMELVEQGLAVAGVPADRVHVERFTIATGGEELPGAAAAPCELTVEIGGRRATANVRPGQTLLMTARAAGLPAPYSCELGTCGTCMARVVEGDVVLKNDEVLTADEVEEGWILMCQAIPTTASVHVVYE